ncbi:MAG: M23 family metallopeptidase [Pseudomonadota bacterium]
MQLVLIANKNKRGRVIHFGLATSALLCLIFFLLAYSAFYLGKLYSNDSTRQSMAILYSQTASDWNREINQQKDLLLKAQENAEKNLDALGTRLSQMQAHVLRLDALGARLAAMSNIQDINFDTNNQPGIGGPRPLTLQDSMEVEDFIAALEKLDSQIQDRADKLHALESLLIDQALTDETLPVGKPIKQGWISSLYGKRVDPITGKIEFHEGVDYAGKSGSEIVAVASGIVTWSGKRYGYGYMVEINHGNGYQTRYAHNKENLVKVGQKVEKGQKIALMGSSGRATGPHVHFEIVNNGKPINPTKLRSVN